MSVVRFREPSGRSVTGEWTDAGIEFGGELYDPEEVDVLPPTEPSKIIGVGPNHVSNVKPHRESFDPPETPEELMIFIKPPNTLVGHGDTVVLRREGDFKHEIELGVVIGEQCRDVSSEEAMDVVAGFTIVNDVTHPTLARGVHPFDPRNWGRSKAFDDAAPIGPVIAPPESVPSDAEMELRVNGEVEQSATRADLIHPVPDVIAEVSSYLTLEAGDVITTGSPYPLGNLADGDQVELSIEGIGTLEHGVDWDV
jgi:2-keto-4-pentenoate hydratase/2-oxohepta-3-ene-1,7-dioic acid hydratase in catechol pathway